MTEPDPPTIPVESLKQKIDRMENMSDRMADSFLSVHPERCGIKEVIELQAGLKELKIGNKSIANQMRLAVDALDGVDQKLREREKQRKKESLEAVSALVVVLAGLFVVVVGLVFVLLIKG